jgi:hypothetical protein
LRSVGGRRTSAWMWNHGKDDARNPFSKQHDDAHE